MRGHSRGHVLLLSYMDRDVEFQTSPHYVMRQENEVVVTTGTYVTIFNFKVTLAITPPPAL